MTGRDEGQATVELALVLPLLVTLALGVLQGTLVARDQILVVHAAREAAREAAVDQRAPGVRAAALRSTNVLKSGALVVETSVQGGSTRAVTVRLRYRSPTDVVLVGPFLPDITLGAKATMRVESPRSGQE